MICFNCILFISMSISLLISSGLTLHTEDIAGGFQAEPQKFTYQVGILVQENSSNLFNLVCSGGIIAENLVLSAAICFVTNSGVLRNYQYSIITDTINWRYIEGIEILIELIYLPGGANYYLNNIAVAKLERYLDIANNPSLSKLTIPCPEELFLGEWGIVSGYGYNWVVFKNTDDGSPQRINIKGGTDDSLRYAEVIITDNITCLFEYYFINIDKQFCGVILANDDWSLRGICHNDAGSPLVINNKIVGLAGLNHEDCDDTHIGSAYTRVSTYAPFINSVINGSPLMDTLIHRNKRHLKLIIAPAA